MVILLLLLSTAVMAEREKTQKFNINFQQNDYKYNFEHIDISSYNKDYVQHINSKTFKYNRTCAVFNASIIFKVDFGYDLELVLQSYRFASNEYRLFPIRFQFNVCDAISENAFGFGDFNVCGNLTCPLTKLKNYHICNFKADPSRFPPLIPNGRYKMEFHALYLSNEIAIIDAYMEISRPFTGV